MNSNWGRERTSNAHHVKEGNVEETPRFGWSTLSFSTLCVSILCYSLHAVMLINLWGVYQHRHRVYTVGGGDAIAAHLYLLKMSSFLSENEWKISEMAFEFGLWRFTLRYDSYPQSVMLAFEFGWDSKKKSIAWFHLDTGNPTVNMDRIHRFGRHHSTYNLNTFKSLKNGFEHKKMPP